MSSQYKTYPYTTKDYKEIYSNSIPCAKIGTQYKFEIKNSVLYFKDAVIDISNMLIVDVLNLLESRVAVSHVGGEGYYSDIIYFPAILLKDCSNRDVRQIRLFKSPLDISKELLEAEYESLSNLVIFDLDTNKEIKFTLVDDLIYYTPAPNTQAVLTTRLDSFFLHIDFDLRHIRDGYSVGNLLKHSINGPPLIIFPPPMEET